MLRHILVAGALLAAGAAASAHGPTGAGHGRLLERADTNQDGMIVRDEFLAMRAEWFARMDRNSDGFLDEADRAEAQQAGEGRRAHARKMHAQRAHARMDADGDGKISKEEFLNAGAPMFDRMDADANSVLDEKEIQAAKEKARSMREKRRWRESAPGDAAQP